MTHEDMTHEDMTNEDHGKQSHQDGSKDGSSVSSSAGGMRLTADFLSPIVVGIFLGFWLDRWLSSTPLFLLSLFFLGIVAGFWNLYRMAKRLEERSRSAMPDDD